MSFLDDGLAPIEDRYGELTMPLLLLTSREDHVVAPADSEFLAEHYGGPVDHRWLERSYHVATQDFDRDVINVAAVEFVAHGHRVVTWSLRRPASRARRRARWRSGRCRSTSTA